MKLMLVNWTVESLATHLEGCGTQSSSQLALLVPVVLVQDVLVGFALLLAYTFGRVMPVLAAASFTGSMKQMLSLRKYSRWINPASGALLLGIGTFSLLNRVFPEASAMALSMNSM